MSSMRVSCGSREFVVDLPDATSGEPQSLLQAVYLSGLFEPPPLCAGLALCGRCRMRFMQNAPDPLDEDFKALGERAVGQGWRLGCRHRAVPGAQLELPPGMRALAAPEPGEAEDQPEADAAEADAGASLAVDFGSTSLHYSILREDDAQPAKIVVNPQMGAGSDIISRLAYAQREGGLERLSRLSRAALGRMAAEAGNTREICLAANPSMTYLLLGKDVSGLAAAPYHLDYRGGAVERLPGLPPIWVAPLMAPFMGGDLSAGYAALAWGQKVEYPFILADLGTNGEFILALSEKEALAASLPLGPALEGIGMSCGSEARPGVITSFALTSDGLVPQMYGQSGPTRGLTQAPSGLSGTAYLSLAHHLRRQGLLLPSGLFADPAAPAQALSPLASRLGRALKDGLQGRAFYLMDSLYMTGGDVEELIKIKAAFSLALKLLLKEAALPWSGLKRLYLAGALGSYADIGALETLGFIPPGGSAKAAPAGNSSLSGAELLCQKPELRQLLAAWAAGVRVLSLTDAPNFQAEYTDEMKFEW